MHITHTGPALRAKQCGHMALWARRCAHLATRQVGMVCGGVAASAGLAFGEWGGPRAFAECPTGVAPAESKPAPPLDNMDKEVIERRDFVVYDHSGRAISLRAVHQALTSVQVALIGEYHDDPIAHALEVGQPVGRANPKLPLGLPLLWELVAHPGGTAWPGVWACPPSH